MQLFFIHRQSAISLLIDVLNSEKKELSDEEKQRCLRLLLDVRARRCEEFYTTGWETEARHLIITPA